ncbi:MAG TPA: 4Fe-4S dicluster domain-containing protein [Thermodesulfobacteriota bacterium]|nr:4Fe-4S dicluster domain-containing protein [Thermodesulfobacteriota bacterium]
MSQKQPKEIFVRLDRCMGCHTCEVACAVEHSKSKSIHGAMSEQPQPKRRVYVEAASPDRPLPVLCRHCEEAPCMHACIAGAIGRVDDVVITNPDKCIGCWTCVMVCPYGVIGRHMEEHKAYRCDRCPEREVPACVSACPTKALVYRTVEDYSKGVRQTAATEMTAGKRS